MSGIRIVAHPGDVNIADIKAVAAEYDATADPSSVVPRGKALLINEAAIHELITGPIHGEYQWQHRDGSDCE